MNANDFKESFRLIEQGIRQLQGGPVDYYCNKLCGAYEYLLSIAPHPAGSRVELAKTPEINAKDSYGWMGSKHFLVEGSVAIVREVDADARGFSYQLEFEDESWIDPTTNAVNAIPPERRHVYGFRADYVRAHNGTGD